MTARAKPLMDNLPPESNFQAESAHEANAHMYIRPCHNICRFRYVGLPISHGSASAKLGIRRRSAWRGFRFQSTLNLTGNAQVKCLTEHDLILVHAELMDVHGQEVLVRDKRGLRSAPTRPHWFSQYKQICSVPAVAGHMAYGIIKIILFWTVTREQAHSVPCRLWRRMAGYA